MEKEMEKMNQLQIDFQPLPYAVEEALNRLRINIKFCGKNTRRIMVTSSVPDEGKSTVSMNLWRMLSEAGFPTVLVDVDLRKSVISSRHNIRANEEIKGLDYYLSGLAEYEEVLCKTNIPNGYMVPCTNLLENPSPLLEDERFRELLDRLAKDFRYVILDTPPLEIVADGALVASLCDGALLVVRSKMTSRTMIRNSLNQIEHAGCKLLGVVLNRVEYSGKYKKYYGKYYGKEKKGESK